MVDIRKPRYQQAQQAAQASAAQAVRNLNSPQASTQQRAVQSLSPQRPPAARRDSGIDTLGINQQAAQQRSQNTRTSTPPPSYQGPDFFLQDYITGGGGGGRPAPRPSLPPIDWRDAAYKAQIASLNRALADFETGTRTNVGRFGEDFMRGLRSLGFRPGEGFEAAPDVTKFRDEAEAMAALRTPAARMAGGPAMDGQWDLEGAFDPFSAAARGTRTSRDEFAGRGTLRSSDFVQSFAEFQDRLNQQLEAMTSGQTRFLEDAARSVMQQRTGTQESREAAEREARARAAIRAADTGARVMD